MLQILRRSVPRAVRAPTGVELRPIPKGLESPPDPTVTRAARLAATLGVTGQKSADGIVTKRPPSWVGQGEGLNPWQRVSRAALNDRMVPDRVRALGGR